MIAKRKNKTKETNLKLSFSINLYWVALLKLKLDIKYIDF